MPRGCQVACFLADIARVDLWYASLLHTFVASDPPEKEIPKTEVHKKMCLQIKVGVQIKCDFRRNVTSEKRY